MFAIGDRMPYKNLTFPGKCNLWNNGKYIIIYNELMRLHKIAMDTLRSNDFKTVNTLETLTIPDKPLDII